MHPLTVQVPIGCWMSAAVLDLWPGRTREADLLVGVGLAAAGPAAVAGAVDWSQLHRQQTRMGLLHAVANTAVVGLYGASLLCRLTGRSGADRAYGFLGLTAIGLGGMLGRHLAYRQASGANHAEEVPHVVRESWHRIGTVASSPPAGPCGAPWMTYRSWWYAKTGGTFHALTERCSHLAGPLPEEAVADGCVRCPWHGSAFRLSDGWNVRGPATAPQPAFDTRVLDGHLEIRLRREDRTESPAERQADAV
ncbi:DUF2231 domain-containing protein [Streptomyces sp. HMX87]|uniref:DUF2231 domain-containing protein n=1 Tax=Streptomyces sp. HMX87 TaxID=3390849 RepID=UPI003A8507F8